MLCKAFDSPDVRLWIAVLTFAFLINLPTGYQMIYLNQPAHLFRDWVNRSTNSQHTTADIILIWSIIVSLRIAGNAIGAVGGAVLADRLGRRDAIRIAALPLALGDGLSFIAMFYNSIICMGIGRLITGIGDAIGTNIFLFCMEVAPARVRGRVGSSLMLMREIGMILGIVLPASYVFGTPELLPYIFLLPVIMVTPAPCLLGLFPKSPRFIYTVERDTSSAMTSVRFYQGQENEMWSIQEKYGLEMQVTTGNRIRELLTNKVIRKSFGLTACFALALTLGGRFVCQNYSSDLFREAGLDKVTAETTTLITQVFAFPVILFTMFSTDQLGRRPIFLGSSMIVIFLQMTAMAFYFSIDTARPVPFHTTLIISLCLGFWIPIMIGGMAALSFVPNELFTQRDRATGSAFYISALFGSGSISTTIFPVLQHMKLGCGILFLIVPLLATTVLLYFFLPETSLKIAEGLGQPVSMNGTEASRLNSCEQQDYGAGIGQLTMRAPIRVRNDQ